MDDSPQPHSRAMRWIAGIVAFAVIAAAGFVVFDPWQRVWGRLAGDIFFDGRPARYWKKQLRAGPGDRAAAIQAFEEARGDAVPLLITFLNEASGPSAADLRWTAAEALGNIGPDAETAGAPLIARLKDADPHVRAVCAAALPKVGAPADDAVPALTEALRREPSVTAIDALGHYRAAAAPALPILAEIAQDQSQEAGRRRAALLAIGDIGPDAAAELSLLTSVLKDDEPLLREAAAMALEMLGAEFAEDSVGPLTAALEDPVPRVRRNALLALGSFGGASRGAVTEIQQCLDDPDDIVQEAARTALQMISPEEFPSDAPSTDGVESAPAVSPR